MVSVKLDPKADVIQVYALAHTRPFQCPFDAYSRNKVATRD